MKKIFTLCFFVLISSYVQAQNYNARAYELLRKNMVRAQFHSMDEVFVSDAYPNETSGTFIVYAQQLHKDIRVANAIQTLVFKNDTLVSQQGAFIGKIQAKAKGNVTNLKAIDAITRALLHLKIPRPAGFKEVPIKASQNSQSFLFASEGVSENDIPVNLLWVPESDGQVTLAWEVGIDPVKDSDNWLVRVDAKTGAIINKVNLTVYCSWGAPEFHAPDVIHNADGTHSKREAAPSAAAGPLAVNSATYRVVPYPAESPQHPGGTFVNRTNPWEAAGAGNPATTLNWHNDGTTEYNYTRGNNVYAQEDRDNNNSTFGTPATSSTALPTLTFTSVFNTSTDPTTAENQAAAITNLFYWNNIIHDIMYQYGFNELSGNFQNDNLGRGGIENDYVIADAQDAGGVNNANFSTPGDGARPRMQMYLWNTASPQKDGDLDNGIIVHEYAHGISNRLTGGPSQVACLQNAEQMGEGWSDYYGLMLTTNWASAQLTDGPLNRAIGTYALAQPTTGNGIRTYPYTTNMSVNPFTYSNVASSASVHYIGSIWATILWDMTWELIQEAGSISASLYDPTATGGNVIAMRLVTEGLKLQPCSPGFVDGRDAILTADTLLYGGQYSCAIWRAFARRGVGLGASQGSSASNTDQTVSFEAPITKITKTANVATVVEGQEITYTLNVDCKCQPISNFTIADTLSVGTTYVSGGSYNATTRVVTFGPISLTPGQNVAYTLKVINNIPSDTITIFTSNGNTLSAWASASLVGSRAWTVSTVRSKSASSSLFMQSYGNDAATTLTSPGYSLPSTEPTFSFWHFYSLENMYDGGAIEISTNGGSTWTDLGPRITQNGYNQVINGCCGTPLSGRPAFSGESGVFIKTIVDLSPYKGQTIRLRFLMAEDYTINKEGWYIDDLLLQSEAALINTAYLRNSSNEIISKSTIRLPIIPSRTIQSVASGLWSNTATWSCGCIPEPADVVVLNSTHLVTIDGGTANARKLVGNGGNIQIMNNGTLLLSN